LLKSFLLSICLIIFFACEKQVKIEHLQGRTMGTSYNVKFHSEKLIDLKVAHQKIDELLKAVNQSMSTYIPSSEISRFNKNNSNSEIALSKEFWFVLSYALSVAEKTQGRFDPTIGPLVNLWGFGPGGERKVPEQEAIDSALERVGYQKLILREQKVRKLNPLLQVDLSASAKGYGVDVVADYLESLGIDDYLVEIGGELRLRGLKGEFPWKVAIEAPDPEKQGRPLQKVLSLKDKAMATSGNYRNFFESKGKRYAHIIDHKTGRPSQKKILSATVITSKSCMVADSWATAYMLMTPLEAIDLANKQNMSLFLIFKDDVGNIIELSSNSFKSLAH
jgi:FAD:protein FMN transferase